MSEIDTNLRAWWAVKTMSEKLGADLSTKLRHGEMDEAEISNLVLRCQACPTPERCENYLMRHDENCADIVETCVNRDLFELHREK